MTQVSVNNLSRSVDDLKTVIDDVVANTEEGDKTCALVPNIDKIILGKLVHRFHS